MFGSPEFVVKSRQGVEEFLKAVAGDGELGVYKAS